MIKKEANDNTYDLKRGYTLQRMTKIDNHLPVRLCHICLDDVSFLWSTRMRNQTALLWPTAYDNDMITTEIKPSL